MLERLKIREKLILAFGTVLLLMLAMAVVAQVEIASIKAGMDRALDDYYPKVVASKDVDIRTLDIARLIRNAILSSDTQQVEESIRAIEDNRRENTAALQALEASISSPRGRELIARIAAARDRLGPAYEGMYARVRASDDGDSIAFLNREFAPANNALLDALNELIKYQVELMERAQADANVTFASIKLVMTVASLAALAVGMVIAFMLSGSLARQIEAVVRRSEQIAQGDFRADPDF
ncbi:MAG: MCP four helix bundle domain-containing protein, partial [Rhodocyclaceae bacterium]